MNWGDVLTVLQQSYLSLPPAKDPWLHQAKSAPSAPALEAEIRHGELLHSAEIESAIAAWKTSGRWPALSGEARFFLRLRHDAACTYVFRLSAPGTHQSLIPLPPLPPPEIAAWFLQEWWEWHGPRTVAQSLTTPFEEDDTD